MSKITKALLIAAVAVMLVGATNAYAYHEVWDGWFNSGSLDYDRKTYEYVESYNIVDDSTYIAGRRDTFYRESIPAIAFVCAAGYDDSIFVYIATFSGGKEYGTSGTHEGDGVWTGLGYSDRSKEPMYYLFDFGGTWDTDDGNDYFDYTDCPCPPGGPPTYSADWDVTSSNPPNVVTGGGTSSGERTYYED